MRAGCLSNTRDLGSNKFGETADCISLWEITVHIDLLKAPTGLALKKPVDCLTSISLIYLSIKTFLGVPCAFWQNQGACFWECCNRIESRTWLGVFLAVQVGRTFWAFSSLCQVCSFLPWGGTQQGRGMFQAELPSFLVPFLAYFYYNLASHGSVPRGGKCPGLCQNILFYLWLCFSFWSHSGLLTQWYLWASEAGASGKFSLVSLLLFICSPFTPAVLASIHPLFSHQI